MRAISLTQADIYKGELILVNAEHPYFENLAKPNLVPAASGNADILLEQNTATHLSQVMEKINGWQQIVPVSGWRSLKEQQDIFKQSLKDNGRTFTQQFVALPGKSEHQTGLAIDLGLKKESIDFIRPDFPYIGICQQFREKSVPYGFIERYPREKEHITGIAHEPWHFRYVGTPHAEIMREHHFCLEEYIDRNYVAGAMEKEYGAGSSSEAHIPYTDSRRQNIFWRGQKAAEAARERKLLQADSGFLEQSSQDVSKSFMKPSSSSVPDREAAYDAYVPFEEEHESRLEERMRHLTDTFSQYLMYLIHEKGLTNADVYKSAIVDKKIFSKIKNNVNYHPLKLTALCLCVGAKLNLDESKDLLARAGYALSPCDKTDIIFSYFIENGIYDMIELDIQLEEHGLPCIIS